MKYAIFCLIGLMVGWFLGANLGVSGVEDIPETQQAELVASASKEQAARVVELGKQLSAKDAELVALQSELEDYRETTSSRNQAEAEEAVAAEEEPVNPFMANVQSMAVESSKTRKLEELEKLKLSLNLTPEQLSALEAFYDEASEREAKVMQQMFAGKSMEAIQTEAIEEATGIKYHSVSQLLKEILTPEQEEVYEDNKAKEALERKEANAYRKLGSLQSQFLLDDDQKDVVFEIFYDKEYAVKSSEWATLEIDTQDPEFMFKSRAIENERLLEELSDALTPEQVEIYRTKLKNEAEMMRKSMQMFTPKR